MAYEKGGASRSQAGRRTAPGGGKATSKYEKGGPSKAAKGVTSVKGGKKTSSHEAGGVKKATTGRTTPRGKKGASIKMDQPVNSTAPKKSKTSSVAKALGAKVKSGKSSGPAGTARSGYGQQKAPKGVTSVKGGKKAPSYEKGGAQPGGRTGRTTKGMASKGNQKKANARSGAAAKAAGANARGMTKKSMQRNSMKIKKSIKSNSYK